MTVEGNKPEARAMGLPRGSVRATIALMLIIAVIGLAYAGCVIPEFLQTITSMVITFYFVTTNSRDKSDAENNKREQEEDMMLAYRGSYPIERNIEVARGASLDEVNP